MRQFEYYKDFTEDELINDEYFQNWILNHADGEVDDFWKTFLNAFPEKAAVVKRASSALQAIPFAVLTKVQEPSKEKTPTSFRDVSRILHFKGQNKRKTKVFLLSSRWWAVAASVLVIASFGYFLIRYENVRQVTKVVQQDRQKHDIAPGGNKAILTLADGSSIVLDSAQNGMLSQQGSAKVIKLEDGKVTYDETATGNQQSAIQYNTISTPRGGQYQLTLADGSQVWLNAASSITFPTAFSGDKREVKITGEAYFEVAHNANMPFRVRVGDMEVQVLGTHFNVNAYSNEPAMQTTLLEGSVKVTEGIESVLLKPGEQATVFSANAKNAIQVQKVNTGDVVSWKNGFFSFRHSGLTEVIKQLSRWYDIDVNYNGALEQQEFSGKIDRDLSLSEVLKILEQTGVHFKIEGRKITILR